MNYLTAVIIAAVSAVMAYVAITEELACKLKIFKVSDKSEKFTSKSFTKAQRILLTALAAVMAFLTVIKLFDKVSDTLNLCKLLLALICMLGAAYFDFREHRIPNIFPLTLALGGIIMLVLGIATGQNGAIAYITSGVIAAVVSVLVLVLASVLTKQGIGAGDIKLIGALALTAGVNMIIGTLFYGVVLCGIAAIAALILKKKNMGSAIPFGPFLLLGYILTVFISKF